MVAGRVMGGGGGRKGKLWSPKKGSSRDEEYTASAPDQRGEYRENRWLIRNIVAKQRKCKGHWEKTAERVLVLTGGPGAIPVKKKAGTGSRGGAGDARGQDLGKKREEGQSPRKAAMTGLKLCTVEREPVRGNQQHDTRKANFSKLLQNNDNTQSRT